MGKYPRKWNLEIVYPSIDSKEFNDDIEKISKKIDLVVEEAKNLPDIADSKEVADKWAEFHKNYEELGKSATQLAVYGQCLKSADTENSEIPVKLSKVYSLFTKMSPIGIYTQSKVRSCPNDEIFQAFINKNEYLKEIEFTLWERLQHTKYMMSDEKEQFYAKLSSDGINAWSRLYSNISGKLKVELEEDGKVVKKSVGQVKYDSPDRGEREKNFFALRKAWSSIKDICAESLNHIVGTRLTVYKEKGVKHFLDMSLLNNRMTKDTIDAMWSTVSERKGMYKRYFEAKAKLMGLDKLSWYDIHAPMQEGKITFDEASDLVIEQYTKFNPIMGEFAKDVLEKGFVESENRQGKQGGAYCTQFKKRNEPRIFMTFTDSNNSLRTLAHEMGHAYHNHVLSKKPLPLQQYPMNLAETASTFGEAIIGDYLLNNAKNDQEKLAMLDSMIADATTYLMNINARYQFEYKFHEKREKGEMSADEMINMCLEVEKDAYLDMLSEYDPMLWASKLHFYLGEMSFYNYSYTFGYLFSNALFAMAKEQGQAFTETYNNILLSTGSMSTEDVISKNLGMDITKHDFWNKSLDLIEERIDAFIKLV